MIKLDITLSYIVTEILAKQAQTEYDNDQFKHAISQINQLLKVNNTAIVRTHVHWEFLKILCLTPEFELVSSNPEQWETTNWWKSKSLLDYELRGCLLLHVP